MTDKPYGTHRTYPEDSVEDSWYEDEYGRCFGRGVKTEFQDMHETLTKQIQLDKDEDEGSDGMFVLSQKTSSLLVEYFTVGSAIIEERCVELLFRELVEEDRQSKSARSFFERNIQQRHREELLYRCGIIDAGFKGKMKEVRNERNHLVHNLDERLYIDKNGETVENVEKALTVVEDLSTEFFRQKDPG